MSKTYRIVTVALLLEGGAGDEPHQDVLNVCRNDGEILDWGYIQGENYSTARSTQGAQRLWVELTGKPATCLMPPPLPSGHISPEEVIRYCRAADETQVSSQPCGVTMTQEGRLGVAYVGPNGRDAYFEGVSATKTATGLCIFRRPDNTQNAPQTLEVRLLKTVHPACWASHD